MSTKISRKFCKTVKFEVKECWGSCFDSLDGAMLTIYLVVHGFGHCMVHFGAVITPEQCHCACAVKLFHGDGTKQQNKSYQLCIGLIAEVRGQRFVSTALVGQCCGKLW